MSCVSPCRPQLIRLQARVEAEERGASAPGPSTSHLAVLERAEIRLRNATASAEPSGSKEELEASKALREALRGVHGSVGPNGESVAATHRRILATLDPLGSADADVSERGAGPAGIAALTGLASRVEAAAERVESPARGRGHPRSRSAPRRHAPSRPLSRAADVAPGGARTDANGGAAQPSAAFGPTLVRKRADAPAPAPGHGAADAVSVSGHGAGLGRPLSPPPPPPPIGDELLAGLDVAEGDGLLREIAALTEEIRKSTGEEDEALEGVSPGRPRSAGVPGRDEAPPRGRGRSPSRPWEPQQWLGERAERGGASSAGGHRAGDATLMPARPSLRAEHDDVLRRVDALLRRTGTTPERNGRLRSPGLHAL